MAIADILRHAQGAVTLRARWVLPMHLPPFENADVIMENGHIAEVRAASRLTPTVDLGNSAILPGFVNVHAHLEYTVLRGLLEDIAFFPWIRQLNALKQFVTEREWIASATLGAAEMLAAGITTIADACDAGATLSALIASGQRGIVYREVFGIEAEPPVEQTVRLLANKVAEMQSHLARLGGEGRLQVGISPHAPYTVRPELFRALSEYANTHGLRQTIHLAESMAESALHETGTGAFAEMFTRRGIRWETPQCSPIAHAARCGALDAPTLAVHGVQATEEDVLLLRQKNTALAHCPKSNGKLAAGIAPLSLYRKHGVPVGLGTDSVVSNNNTDMFDEMRHAIFQARVREQQVEALTAREALAMATIGGAEALGLANDIGTLTRGKHADLCVVRLDGLHLCPATEDSVTEALVYSARASDVALTMVGGAVLYEMGHFPGLDVGRARFLSTATRARLAQERDKQRGKA
jgi:5-methylthioadenosine/S-adenosylhomocysteine deaminase